MTVAARQAAAHTTNVATAMKELRTQPTDLDRYLALRRLQR
jgi:hypothetical protein